MQWAQTPHSSRRLALGFVYVRRGALCSFLGATRALASTAKGLVAPCTRTTRRASRPHSMCLSGVPQPEIKDFRARSAFESHPPFQASLIESSCSRERN